MKLNQNPFIVILGIIQDGGLPQCGCKRLCCKKAWKKPSLRKWVASLAIIDPKTKQRWLIDATPDFKHQLAFLDQVFSVKKKSPGLAGIFLTHGHAGHYTGLLCFEKSTLNSKNVLVWTMPKMEKLLKNNIPWKGLVKGKNIAIKKLCKNKEVALNNNLSVLPFLVSHRDEFTETIGFFIKGPNKTCLFVPDIDNWQNIEEKILKSDIAFLDGTFFEPKEIPNRDISKIPHPLIKESIKRFADLPLKEKQKIHFIHFNHTNPVLVKNSRAQKLIKKNHFRIAKQGQEFSL